VAGDWLVVGGWWIVSGDWWLMKDIVPGALME
jgi:hypothetical protein